MTVSNHNYELVKVVGSVAHRRQAETYRTLKPPGRVFSAALIYFGIVFGTGFILGPIRVLLLVPRVGERWAELLEAPVMLVAIVLVARWTSRKFELRGSSGKSLAVGLLALFFVLILELGLVLKLRGLTISEYWQTRDPISGTVYYVTLGLFALMPLVIRLIAEQRHPRS